MPVVSQVATLRIDDAATHTTSFLQYVATAAAQDIAAGGSVVVNTVQSFGGVSPASPDTLTLSFLDDSGTLIRSFVLPSAGGSATFFLTGDGTATGAPRAGTVEIAIRATRTTGAPGTNYDVQTNGSPNTPPSTFDTHLNRGWIRGTTTSTTVLSNVALGGAKNTPGEYHESLFARTTLGAAFFVARALTVNLSGATPALSGSASGVGPVFDVTFASVVDNRYPAAVTSTASSLTVPNAALTGLPDTVLTATNDSITVDPRLTASHDFQVDNNTFSRALNDPSQQMLSTQTGFLATRLVTSRTASGVNGLTVTQTLTPVGPGVAVTASSSTATRDGQAGWTDLLAWPSSKPGGTWNKTVQITATPDITGAAYVLAGTAAYTLLAPDPRVAILISLNSTMASEDDHLHSGDVTALTTTAFSRATGARVAPDPGTVYARLVRWNRTLAQFEFLAVDGVTWTAWTGTSTVADVHPLADAGDGVTFSKTFSATGGWTTTDIVGVAVVLKIGGTPYGASIGRELTGTPHGHASFTFDPTGLFK